MFNAFAMVQVGCITREPVSTVIYIPSGLRPSGISRSFSCFVVCLFFGGGGGGIWSTLNTSLKSVEVPLYYTMEREGGGKEMQTNVLQTSDKRTSEKGTTRQRHSSNATFMQCTM